MALSVADAQTQLEGRYSDYLKKKRDLQGVRDTAEQRFVGAFGPQGETGAVVNPADIFSSFRTFQSAVPGEAESLALESDILKQIAELAKAQQPSAASISEQLAAREQGLQIVDGQLVPMDGGTGKITPEKESELLKLRESRIAAGLDTADIDEMLGLKGKIGEDEVNAVKLIDDILTTPSAVVAGSTGVFKTGRLTSPFKTPTLRNKLKQLSAILALASAGKLKGSGAVSDAERQLLANSVTALGLTEKGTTDIQPSELKAQLEQIRVALAKKSNDPTLISKYSVQNESTTPTAGPQPTYGGYVIQEVK